MPDLSIVIVNFNQLELLEKCVHSLFEKIHDLDFEVIIVNNSKEDNLSELKATFPSVTIIENDNSGFSHANNAGAEKASGEYLLFLNADTELSSDVNTHLFDEIRKLEFGVLGPKLTFSDGRFQNSVGLFPSIMNEYKNRKIEKAFKRNDRKLIENRTKYFSNIREVDWVTGAAMIVKNDKFKKVWGFDERFFLYYEDIDLCYRLKSAGFRNLYYPDLKVIHHKGEIKRIDNQKNLKNIQNESQRLYYKFHLGVLQRLLLGLYRTIAN